MQMQLIPKAWRHKSCVFSLKYKPTFLKSCRCMVWAGCCSDWAVSALVPYRATQTPQYQVSEKEVLGQHEKADLCWPVSLFFHSVKLPDKCLHGKFIVAESLISAAPRGFSEALTEGISYRALWFCSADRQGRGTEWKDTQSNVLWIQVPVNLGINNDLSTKWRLPNAKT